MSDKPTDKTDPRIKELVMAKEIHDLKESLREVTKAFYASGYHSKHSDNSKIIRRAMKLCNS